MRKLIHIVGAGAVGLALAVGCSKNPESSRSSENYQSVNETTEESRYANEDHADNDSSRKKSLEKKLSGEVLKSGNRLGGRGFVPSEISEIPTIGNKPEFSEKIDLVKEQAIADLVIGEYVKEYPYSYPVFRAALDERLNHVSGHDKTILTDTLYGFYNGVTQNVPELQDDLCNALLEPGKLKNTFSQEVRNQYQEFNPQPYVERSLWKPLTENGVLSEEDKLLYFVFHTNDYLKESFEHMFTTYAEEKKYLEDID